MASSLTGAATWRTRPAGLLLGWLLLVPALCAAEIRYTNEEVAFMAERPVIRLGVPTVFKPVSFAEDGNWQGVSAAFLNEVDARTDLDFELVISDSWPQLQEQLLSGEIDALPIMFWTEERGDALRYTRPYVRIELQAYTRASDTDVMSMADLAGRIVAIPENILFLERLAKNHPEANFIRVENFAATALAVQRGDADVAFINEMLLDLVQRQERPVKLRPAFRAPFEGADLHIVTRGDMPVLRNIIQKGLDDIPSERAAEIIARWEGDNNAVALPDTIRFSDAERDFLAASRQLSACVHDKALPLESFGKGGHRGATSAYATIISERLGVPVRVVSRNSWSATEESLVEGHCDYAMLGVDTTRSGIILGDSWHRETLVLVTTSERAFIEDLTTVGEARIGVVEGFASVSALRDRFPGIRFERIDTREEAFARVTRGELFGALDLVSTASQEIRSRYSEKLKISSVVADEAIQIRIATASPLLSSILDKVIVSIPVVQREAMLSGWSTPPERQALDMQTLLPIIIVLSVVLAFVLFRLVELRGHRHEMRRKTDELQRINSDLESQKHSAMHLAYHDQLTGLSNRSKLMMDAELALKRAQRNGSRLALMFLDLDRFKWVNDSLGHDVGDKLLVSVAKRMHGLLRDTDQLCRLGGDEFIIVLEDIDNQHSPSLVSERIIDSLGKPFIINGQSISVGTSIGISLYPENSDDINTLLKYADSAMYSAKESGRNAFRYFHDDMSSKASRRVMIESALREAIDNNDFSLALQPIVCLKTGRVIKAEALIRWEHPVVGSIAPDEFIPIAEEVGLIVDIGEWVFRNSCNIMATLEAMQQPLESLSINVSSVEFARGDISRRFSVIAEECGVSPEKIELEITERHMLGHNGDIEKELVRMTSMGHRISIDDFGTGYSSLSYLKRIPLNTIKIDRSFIASIPKDQNDIEITQAIISLSHALGYAVVAEGVETREQMRFLVERGCDCAQGYYFSRPVAAEEFLDAVEELNDHLEKEIGFVAAPPALSGL